MFSDDNKQFMFIDHKNRDKNSCYSVRRGSTPVRKSRSPGPESPILQF